MPQRGQRIELLASDPPGHELYLPPEDVRRAIDNGLRRGEPLELRTVADVERALETDIVATEFGAASLGAAYPHNRVLAGVSACAASVIARMAFATGVTVEQLMFIRFVVATALASAVPRATRRYRASRRFAPSMECASTAPGAAGSANMKFVTRRESSAPIRWIYRPPSLPNTVPSPV